MKNFKIGDYVMVEQSDMTKTEKGVIVDVCGGFKNMYYVLTINDTKRSYVGENELKKFNPTSLEKIKLKWFKAKYMLNKAAEIPTIKLYFIKLAGLFYNFTSRTRFCIFRLKASDEFEKSKTEYIDADGILIKQDVIPRITLEMKHVIQIRKECPQYWKKFHDVINLHNYVYLNTSNFFDYINKPIDQTKIDDNTYYNYFIIIAERKNK